MTLVGVGILSLGATVSAIAQNQPTSDNTMNSNRKMNRKMRMMDSNRAMSDMDMSDPAPLSYPLAAPGSLDLYHWRTYRRDVLADGSIRDERERQEMMMDRRLNRGSIKEDPLMVDPMPLNYPLASPGALDLYHFRTYNSNELVAGSTEDARMDKMMARDRARRMETRITDNEEMADPASMNYPVAAPGSLDLYHYRTYRGNTLAPGSATEAREAHQKKMDQMRMNNTSNQ